MHYQSHMEMGQLMSDHMRSCIQECQNCHSVCLENVRYCFQMGGEHASPTHIGLILDCAEICQTSTNFMLRMSDFYTETCGVCAEICERCAHDCARFENDSVMQQCTEACRRCAQSCREMAA